MPWCPNCKEKYSGFEKCPECGEALTEEFNDKSEDTGQSGMEDEVFLANISGPVEVSYITSMLEEEGIPYRAEDSDIGLYLEALMGSSYMGKNILVGKKDYKRAAGIVESFKAQTLDEDNGPQE